MSRIKNENLLIDSFFGSPAMFPEVTTPEIMEYMNRGLSAKKNKLKYSGKGKKRKATDNHNST